MSQRLKGKRIAVLVETEFIPHELDEYKKQFTQEGAQVELLTYLWGKESRDLICDIDNAQNPISSIRILRVEECVSKHDPTEYDVVLMAANYCAVRLREITPMGSLGSPGQISLPPAVRFFASAMENPRIIKGALCHALWILTPRKDLLQGRKVICHTVVLADVLNAGAIFVPDPSHVVVDNDLVTGRSAADIGAYIEAIIRAAARLHGGPACSDSV